MFWEKDSVEYEIFKQYERALVSLGVNFSLEDVQMILEACTYDLENALKSTISYILWLRENNKEVFPSQILIRALREQWKPMAWKDEYLELPILESPGQRWWNAAAKTWGYDLRNRLVADVFYDNGTEFIKFTNGKEITVDTAWRWEWERLLKYATNR
ncbi:hypothetical protein [Halotia branconii]|uniref:Uncharacterized protein n=1 Tax=Halotia branconii CENA392 TaxID=1539056 RepID=A0AAJ6NP93_9CYAN|nr:hypothetical protein [Halotia branconii]WGV24208.1 hypothetical protein QI031_20745 [Halotia branconii CENA392]